MTSIKFDEHRDKIVKAIEDKFATKPILGENGFTLVEGFIMEPLSNEVSGNIIVGGPRIPLIAVVGNTSGQMYYFALKALLPELQF